MAGNNDSRILELKKEIEIKKAKLKESKIKFAPETNCILDFEGCKYNINVLNKEQLLLLVVKLNMYNMSADNLKISHVSISGYTTDEWITDIMSKISVIETRDAEQELKSMETTLEKLLSDDKKTELEINAIEALLKGGK